MNKAQLREDYLEAVRLSVWYSESKFSFFQGKANKEQETRWRNIAHNLLDKMKQAD